MAKARSRRYQPSDVAMAQSRYAETCDPMYLALAVGAMPHKPPLWVIEECARLVDKIGAHAHRGITPEETGNLLDEMCRYFMQAADKAALITGPRINVKGPSVKEAVRHALRAIANVTKDRQGFDSALRCLEREWEQEQQDIAPGYEDTEVFDNVPYTPRMVRALLEWGDNDAGHPFRYVSLEIARRDRL